MAVIDISNQFIKLMPDAFELIKERFKDMQELMPKYGNTKRYFVEYEGKADDESLEIIFKVRNGKVAIKQII